MGEILLMEIPKIVDTKNLFSRIPITRGKNVGKFVETPLVGPPTFWWGKKWGRSLPKKKEYFSLLAPRGESHTIFTAHQFFF